jgi:hypothetical protein
MRYKGKDIRMTANGELEGGGRWKKWPWLSSTFCLEMKTMRNE